MEERFASAILLCICDTFLSERGRSGDLDMMTVYRRDRYVQRQELVEPGGEAEFIRAALLQENGQECLNAQHPIAPGGTKEFANEAREEGEKTLICTFPGHCGIMRMDFAVR
jgi:hypothetical protein